MQASVKDLQDISLSYENAPLLVEINSLALFLDYCSLIPLSWLSFFPVMSYEAMCEREESGVASHTWQHRMDQ